MRDYHLILFILSCAVLTTVWLLRKVDEDDKV